MKLDSSVFSSVFCEERPETLLWLAVIEKAMEDRFHKNSAIRQNADAFFFDKEDNRFCNLLGVLLGFKDPHGIKGTIAEQVRLLDEKSIKEPRTHSCGAAFDGGTATFTGLGLLPHDGGDRGPSESTDSGADRSDDGAVSGDN